MNWRTWTLIGLVGAGLTFVLLRFKNAIAFEFVRLQFLGFEGLRAKMKLVYRVLNSNDTPMTIKGFKGQLRYGNDYELAELNIVKPVSIQPGQNQNIDVIFSISPLRLVGEAAKWIEVKDNMKRFRVVGTLSGVVGQVPFFTTVNTMLAMADE